MELSGNKGEWSELYALFKLLADKELSAGDADLNKIESLIYPIISIIRNDISDEIHYGYNGANVIIKSSNGEILRIIPVSKFKENAELLLKKIRQGSSSFEIPEVEDFRGEAMAECIKAPSSKKADITIVVHDNRTGVSPTLSFSIKSQLGNPSTLLNSAQNTNFIFRLSNKITRDQLNEINSIDSQLERMRKLEDNSVILTFEGIQDSKRNGNMYFCNLQKIDTSMPDIMAQFVLIAVTNSLSSVKDITSKMTELNPLGFNFSHHHTFYETKIKRLLVDAALGMKPGELWNGKYEANGGYLVVKDDGDVLCYHIYNKNDFEDYLFNNVKIDYPSRTRHDYGYIYEENGCQKIKLNFQIRFIR